MLWLRVVKTVITFQRMDNTFLSDERSSILGLTLTLPPCTNEPPRQPAHALADDDIVPGVR